MCVTCGCSDGANAKLTDLDADELLVSQELQDLHSHGHSHSHGHGHEHSHDHEHPHSHEHHEHNHDPVHMHGHEPAHAHPHDPGQSHDSHEPVLAHSHANPTTIRLEQDVLAKNNQLAERNRGWFAGREILALNLVSSPGAGKTTLLERTIRELGPDLTMSVVEGDQETANDAERIRATGCRVVQINTGTGCHLDAAMLARGLEMLRPQAGSVVVIENVGNLVCPALFDLGERAKVLVASVTEGEDKPAKYPHMFRASELVLLNKIDLLPYVSFNVDRFVATAREVNPRIQILKVSATRGDGLDEWYAWLRKQAAQKPVLAAP